MKYKLLLLFITTTIFYFFATAQTVNGKISGVIRDIQGNPLDGATVSLLYATDSSTQKTLVANEEGKFVFKSLTKNFYIITASFTGCIKHISTPFIVDAKHTLISLPPIVLQRTDKSTLRNVTVTTQKRLIEQKLDRTIVNVDAMITAAGGTALEVLAKSPGVMVDMNGNISLNGKNGVLVLIDDRPTYMSAQDLADYLKSLPAGILDKVELMSNPPAKYDAAGGAVINIVLKKNRATGFNGNASTGYNQGVYARSNSSLNVNYRDKKFNIFGNFSYSTDKNFNNTDDSRYFYNADGSANAAVLVNSRYTSQYHAWNARMGMDYFISPKTTVGIMVTGTIRPKTDMLDYNSNQYEGSMKLDSITTGNTIGAYYWGSNSVNLNIQHEFNNNGKTLTADVDHINYHSNSTQVSPNYVYLPDNVLDSSYGLLFTTPSNVNIWSAKADYTQPLKGNARFDAGFKSSYVTNNNQLNWFNQASNAYVQDYSKSDHFIYSENINAAYITVAKEWKRWAVQGGLRMENSQANGQQLSNAVVQDSSFTKTYTKLFPTSYLSYKLDSSGNNTLTLSLSSRVHRPNYQQLNPFLFYHDKYTYTGGNPALAPSYSHNFELRYNYKQYIGVTATYGEDKYLSYNITQAVGNLFITRPQNFGTRKTVGIIPNFSFSPTKWWSVNISSVLLYFINKGNGISPALDQNTSLHEVEVFSQLHFNKGWSAELTGFFPGKQTFGQSQRSSIYNISAGVQKTILHKQGTIRLKVDDIFHTMNISSKSIGINQVSAFHTGETDTRQIGISFSYRFGKEANARKRNHNTGGAGDEEKRAN